MIRIILGIIIGAALFVTVAQAEEQKTVTPKEFVETVASVPGKVQTHLQNEWVEIKAYQAKSWADSKAQLNRNWVQIKNLFTTKSTK